MSDSEINSEIRTLALVLDKLTSIEEAHERLGERLSRIEDILLESNEKIEAIHKHVPFVDWLDERRRSLQSVFSVSNTLRNIGLTVAPILSSEVVETITEEAPVQAPLLS